MALDPPPILEWAGAITFLMFAFIVQVRSPMGKKRYRRDYNEIYKKAVPGAPPGYVYGIVWFVLYFLLFVSGYLTWLFRCDTKGAVERYHVSLALFVANILASMAWTPLFFQYKRYWLALADAGLMIGLSFAFILVMLIPWAGAGTIVAGWLFVPYFAWLLYAFYLNYKVAVYMAAHGASRKKNVTFL